MPHESPQVLDGLKSLKLRRKIASWDVNRLAEILMIQPG